MFTYRHWTFHHLNVRLIKQDLLGSCAEGFDFSLLNVLTPFKLFNPRVDIEGSTSTLVLRSHYFLLYIYSLA
jgi:hypothetical protein